MMDDLISFLIFKGIQYEKDISTASLTTFRIGGPCRMLVTPRTENELALTVCFCAQNNIPYAVIGKGSNCLFCDEQIEEVIIRTLAVSGISSRDNRIRAACGATLSSLCAFCATAGFSDLAFACGIPGTVGGGIYMNAGAHGGTLADSLISVTSVDPISGKIETHDKKELNTSYRYTDYQSNNRIILSAEFMLIQKDDPDLIREKMRELLRIRALSQPLDLPSAGSVFLRPSPDLPMGRVLEELGLKGLRCGGAQVSVKHAGFIVNTGGATAHDVKMLIGKIQTLVEKEKGFRPVPEIRYIPNQK